KGGVLGQARRWGLTGWMQADSSTVASGTSNRQLRFTAGCLTVLGARRTRERIPRGKPWDRQPISGKLRRKFGVSPGFAAYRHPTPPRRLSTRYGEEIGRASCRERV